MSFGIPFASFLPAASVNLVYRDDNQSAERVIRV